MFLPLSDYDQWKLASPYEDRDILCETEDEEYDDDSWLEDDWDSDLEDDDYEDDSWLDDDDDGFDDDEYDCGPQ